MALKDFYEGLRTQLAADAMLEAWAQGHFSRSWTFLEGVAAGQIHESELPAIVIDNGVLREFDRDNEAEAAVLGGARMRVSPALVAVFVWTEDDVATLLQQRLELPDIVIRAVMADDSLGNRVDEAWVSAWAWLASQEPRSLLATKVSGTYDLSL